MTENEFLNEINKESGKDIYRAVVQLLREGVSVSKSMSIFQKLFRRKRIGKTSAQIIEENLETILEGTVNNNYITHVLEELNENERTRYIIEEHFNTILQSFYTEQEGEVMLSMESKRVRFLDMLLKTSGGREIIGNNIDSILKTIPKKYIFGSVQMLKGISTDINDKLNEYLEQNKEELAKSLLSSRMEMANSLNTDEFLGKYVETLSIMIDELLKSEKVRLIDMERIGTGGYSSIFQIGNKVLKIGKPRETYNIPNHRRILQPLTRINFTDKHGDAFACVEISDKVEPAEELGWEDLYQLFKELRDDGIIWSDVKLSNLGKLTKANTPTLDGEDRYVFPNSVGFNANVKEAPLEAGDLVIIDTDYIYNQYDQNIRWIAGSESYERRWQNERQEEIAKRYGNEKGKKISLKEEESYEQE